jgi:hypothetical protein
MLDLSTRWYDRFLKNDAERRRHGEAVQVA